MLPARAGVESLLFSVSEVMKSHIIRCFGENLPEECKSLSMLIKNDGTVDHVKFIPEVTLKEDKVRKFISELPLWKPGMQHGRRVDVSVLIEL